MKKNMNHMGCSFSADYFSLGVICHELLLKKRPCHNSSNYSNQNDSSCKKFKLRTRDLPEGVEASKPMLDFINKLLHIDPSHRLGSSGINEIICHPWFEKFDWVSLENGILSSPYQPGEIERRRYLKLRTIALEGSLLEEKQAIVDHHNKVTSRLP